MRITTVAMKPAPSANAISRIFLLSIIIFLEYSTVDESSSDVTNRIIAMTASQRLISANVRGQIIFQSPIKRYRT